MPYPGKINLTTVTIRDDINVGLSPSVSWVRIPLRGALASPPGMICRFESHLEPHGFESHWGSSYLRLCLCVGAGSNTWVQVPPAVPD